MLLQHAWSCLLNPHAFADLMSCAIHICACLHGAMSLEEMYLSLHLHSPHSCFTFTPVVLLTACLCVFVYVLE